MRECGDGVQPAHGAGTLDGVKGPEKLVDGLTGSLSGVQRERRLLNSSQQFFGFLQIGRDRVI